MANFVYNEYKKQLLLGGTVWTTGVFKAMLANSSSTCASQPGYKDVNTLSGFTTLGRHAGSTDQTLSANTVTENASPTSTAAAVAGNVSFGAIALEAGKTMIGVLVYWEPASGAADSNRIPVFWSEDSPLPVAASGSAVTWRPNAAGLFYIG